ncbi:lipoprotein [Microvirga sp. W0021]|uniref:Lipoprotein n=1 Tax=Hohaiivirga grylli TaxID=3133970 RepID=A0ABV0BM90_9HYPH
MLLRRYNAVLSAVGIIALTLAACGRAGPLEPPPRPGEVAQQGMSADDNTGNMASPLPTPQKSTKRPVTIPNEPFFLDPIL